MIMSIAKAACSISTAARKEVLKRDDYRCIICGSKHDLQIAHFISRARLGLGIPENLVTLCYRHHYSYDNGYYHNEIKLFISDYLKNKYPDWKQEKLVYKKGCDLK